MPRFPLRALIAATLAFTLGSAQPALAWGDVGHRTIAAIALANVSPATAAQIDQLLTAEAGLGTPTCKVKSFADAATWPDCLRGEAWRWAYTFPYHYQDSDVPGPGFNAHANCPNGACATAQIERDRRIVADKSLPAAQRLEALAFLAHIVGDIHQPLHAAEHDHDHGGNGVKVSYAGNANGTLHWLWDSAMAERGVATAPSPIIRTYSAAERAQIATGQPADWAQESWVLARDVVYPQVFGHAVAAGEMPSGTFAVSDAQIDAGAPVARQRLVQAGLRLASVLDAALGQ